MIGLKVNGGWLELPKKVTFSMKRTSPIFFGKNFNIISGSYSLPMTIDASPNNRKRLKFPEYLNNQGATNDFNCELYFDGNLINRGILNWKDASPGTYKIQFFSSAGALAQLKEKTWADYDYGGELTINPNTLFDDYDWFKPFSFVWRWEYDNDTTYTPTYNTAGLVIGKTLGRVLNQEGYSLNTTFFDDEEYANLVLFKPYVFLNNTDTVQRDLKQAAPQQFVADGLRGMANNFCLAVDVDSTHRQVNIKTHNELLDAPLPAIDMTDRVTSVMTRRKIRGNGKSLIKSFEFEHFDEVTDDNKEKGSKIHTYNVLPSVKSHAFLPLTPNDGDAVFVANKSHYIARVDDNWDVDNGFQAIFKLQQDTEQGTAIKSPLVPPALTVNFNDRVTPFVSQKPTRYDGEDFSERSSKSFLAFYRANIATYNNIDSENEPIGEKTLNWQGEHGLFETNWRKWLEFLNEAYECECDMQLTDADLFNFNPLQPIKIFDEHSGGYHYYYWLERKIVLNNNGIQVARQKLLQVIF